MSNFINRRMIAATPLLFSMMMLLCFTAAFASAQESGAAAAPVEAEQGSLNQRSNLIRTLGLTAEQLARIRMIREQNKEERRLANERLESARRALDEAIYADAPSEAVIEERARELAVAQATTVRLRALTELSIRRVLTPEQLSLLRTLRQQQSSRRVERQLNIQRRLRERRRAGNPDGQLAFPRQRFRQRDNAPEPQTDENNPSVVSPPERRREVIRRRRP